MKKVLILHGWFATPKNDWYPWVKKQLELKGYDVFTPQLADKDKPTFGRWKQCALRSSFLDKDTIVIGHSLGAILGLKLAEEYRFLKLITVSGWDFWDLTPEHKTFFKTLINHKKIMKNVSKRVVIHSDNDPFVTATIAEEFSKRLRAKFVLIPGKGHFIEKNGVVRFPELLKYV